MKRELERVEIPNEHESRERSWAVVSAAFAERETQPRSRSWKPVAVVALAVVVVAGLLSPPGRAVLAPGTRKSNRASSSARNRPSALHDAS